MVSLQFNNLHFDIVFTEKCYTSSLCSFIGLGEREKEAFVPLLTMGLMFFSDVFLLSVFESYLIVFVLFLCPCCSAIVGVRMSL